MDKIYQVLLKGFVRGTPVNLAYTFTDDKEAQKLLQMLYGSEFIETKLAFISVAYWQVFKTADEVIKLFDTVLTKEN